MSPRGRWPSLKAAPARCGGRGCLEVQTGRLSGYLWPCETSRAASCEILSAFFDEAASGQPSTFGATGVLPEQRESRGKNVRCAGTPKEFLLWGEFRRNNRQCCL